MWFIVFFPTVVDSKPHCKRLIEIFAVGSCINAETTTRQDFILDQLNRTPAGFILTNISFTIDHHLSKAISMDGEQIDQFGVFYFTMQIHKDVFKIRATNIMQVSVFGF